MCGHSCCLGSKESQFVGEANAIGAGVVRLLYYLPIDGKIESTFSKDMSQESQLLRRRPDLQSQATSWIRGKWFGCYDSLRGSDIEAYVSVSFRSSTVFGVFIFFGSLFFALGLGYRPEMAFVLYFALTFMDAILTFNPCKLQFLAARVQQLV